MPKDIMPNSSMPNDCMPNDSMPKRDYAKWLYAKKGLCQKAVCQKTVCQMTLCQMTVCQLTVCQKAVCQKAVSQKAVCQMTVCQFTAQPNNYQQSKGRDCYCSWNWVKSFKAWKIMKFKFDVSWTMAFEDKEEHWELGELLPFVTKSLNIYFIILLGTLIWERWAIYAKILPSDH